MDRLQPRTRTAALLLAVALANAGGVVAYLPLFTLLLPLRVEALDELAKIDLLTATAGGGGNLLHFPPAQQIYRRALQIYRGGPNCHRTVVSSVLTLAAPIATGVSSVATPVARSAAAI